MIDSKTIGMRVALLRQKNNMTQSDLASKLDVEQSRISRIENGEGKQINIELIGKILSLFACPAEVFFADSNRELIGLLHKITPVQPKKVPIQRPKVIERALHEFVPAVHHYWFNSIDEDGARILIVGPMGSGKTALANALIKRSYKAMSSHEDHKGFRPGQRCLILGSDEYEWGNLLDEPVFSFSNMGDDNVDALVKAHHGPVIFDGLETVSKLTPLLGAAGGSYPYIATMHAQSADRAMGRLQTTVALESANTPSDDALAATCGAFDVVIELVRGRVIVKDQGAAHTIQNMSDMLTDMQSRLNKGHEPSGVRLYVDEPSYMIGDELDHLFEDKPSVKSSNVGLLDPFADEELEMIGSEAHEDSAGSELQGGIVAMYQPLIDCFNTTTLHGVYDGKHAPKELAPRSWAQPD